MTLLMTWLFAVLTLCTWVGIVGVLVHPGLRAAARPHAVEIASAVTGTATVGSLYLSEVAGYVPCELCWVQRILMYPLAVITLVALLRRRTDVWAYAVPLIVMGLATSIWHVIVQRLPAAGATCDPTNPCSAIWIERFGVITIPVMAGSAFLVALTAAWLGRRPAADTGTDTETDTREELTA